MVEMKCEGEKHEAPGEDPKEEEAQHAQVEQLESSPPQDEDVEHLEQKRHLEGYKYHHQQRK